MKFAVVAHRRSATNAALVAAAAGRGLEAEVLDPRRALTLLEPGDLALARLDVRAELDGIERGTDELERLAAGGVDVRNPPGALVVAHDKLLTARTLRRSPACRTRTRRSSALRCPLRCPSCRSCSSRGSAAGGATWSSARRRTSSTRRCSAFRGSLVPPARRARPGICGTPGWDLRLVVAGGRVVGAACRIARSGEWRTNAALGAQVEPVEPPPIARTLALAAARAARADLVGVDLLPTANGFLVLELNGAVDFRPVYAPHRNVFGDAVAALLDSAARKPELAAASA